jgi:hypothetical protein
MRPVTKVVNYVYIIEIKQSFSPLIAILTRAAREPADNSRRGPLP